MLHWVSTVKVCRGDSGGDNLGRVADRHVEPREL